MTTPPRDNRLTPEMYDRLRAAKLGTTAKVDPIDRLTVALTTKRADMKLRPQPVRQIDPVAAAPDLALADDRARRDSERQASAADLRRAEIEEANRQHEERWEKRAVALTGFPARLVRDLDANGYAAQIQADPRYARLWRSVKAGGLLALKGPPGTGKSTVALVLARAFMRERHAWAVYAKADDYLASFRAKTQGFNSRTTQSEWINDRTQRDGFLILDELDKVPGLYGDGFMSKQIECWLEAILDARHSALSRPTLLLANFNDEQWNERVPAPTRDRFKSDGAVVNYAGPSLRKHTEDHP